MKIRKNILISFGIRILSFVLIILCYFRNLLIPFPFLNYSDKIIFLSALIGIFLNILNKNNKIWQSKETTLFLFLIFISVIASIFGINYSNSLLGLRFLVTGFLLFVFFGSITDKTKIAQKMLLWTILNALSIIISLFSLLLPLSTLNILSYFFDLNSNTIFSYDFLRGRIIPVGAIYLTFLLPLSLFFTKKRNVFSISGGILIFASGIFSILISNYRSSFLAMITGIFFFILSFKKKILNSVLILFLIVLIINSVIVSRYFFGFSVIERFTPFNASDIVNLDSRVDYIKEALDIFKKKPLFGVGLNNYSQSVASLNISTTNQNGKNGTEVLPGNPHNLFLLWLAETGLIGFISFLILLYNFFISDLIFLKKQIKVKPILILLIISSWLYLVGSLMDSWLVYLFYNFCIFRGLLRSFYTKLEI